MTVVTDAMIQAGARAIASRFDSYEWDMRPDCHGPHDGQPMPKEAFIDMARAGLEAALSTVTRAGLTPQQKAALDVIRELSSEGVAPSLDDIAAAMQRSKSTAKRLVDALEERGYIRRDAGHARNIVIV